jgi:hypothetical protein
MITNLRFIMRDGKKILQQLGPASTGEIDEDGYLKWDMQDMKWQDVPLEEDVVHLDKAS